MKIMISIRYYIHQVLLISCIFLLIFCPFSSKLFAEEIEWLEVSKTNNDLLFIDPNSIKYNNKGLLSVITKHTNINPDDQTILNTDSYLMAIDCKNRLFSKLSVDDNLKQVKNWDNSINNKLIKKAIIKSCSY